MTLEGPVRPRSSVSCKSNVEVTRRKTKLPGLPDERQVHFGKRDNYLVI
jgi:hypothetical protein